MLVLSNLGCQFFFWMGLMDAKGCDELRIQEENLDTLMWFKLLFVPTLGIIILTLFLLEDYCYSFQSKTKDPDDGDDVIKPRTKYRSFWRRSGDRHHRDNKNKPSEPTRLNLVDEHGVGNCYKIEPTISMREVLQFYCQRNNTSSDAIILRHQGKKINPI